MEAITWKNFDITKVIFEDVKKITFGDIKFQRIYLKYEYKPGFTDKLYVTTPREFSWGIQENYSQQGPTSITGNGASGADKPVESYTMSLVMYDAKSGPTEAQAKTIEIFEAILTKVKHHLKLASTKKALDKYNMDPFVDVMDIFFRKRDKGELVKGCAPTLYPKLLTKFDKNRRFDVKPEILSGFYNCKDESIDPEELIKTRCELRAEILVDSIYIGAKPSIQLKLNDAIILNRFAKVRRLFYNEVEDGPATDGSRASGIRMLADDDDDIDYFNM